MNSDILYFDYAATTPCAPEVADAIYTCLTNKSINTNASSSHRLADTALAAIEDARGSCANLIGAKPSEIVFTSGATESDNLALLGMSPFLKAEEKTHIVSSSSEHKAVLDTLKHLEKLGHKVTLIDPNAEGVISIGSLSAALQPDTGLVSIMHANNETGVVQDIESLGALAKHHGAVFHVDAAQSAGKLPINVETMNIDLLSMCAHKVYGPKGCGALFVRSHLQKNLSPMLFGGGQEKRIRPGTYANHQIIGLGKTFDLAIAQMEADLAYSSKLRSLLIDTLGNTVTNINGSPHGLPNILNVSIDGVDATTLLTTLQDRVALATGSACNSGTVSPSHVLRAMGIDGERLGNAIRISFGRYTSLEDAEMAGQIIRKEAERIRSFF